MRPPRPRRLLLSGLLLAALVGGTARAALPTADTPPVPAVAAVTVTDCPADGVVVPRDYLGLSIEWSMVQHWFGTGRSGVVEPTVSLLRSLNAAPDTGGVLRIGGNSQDGYVWNPHADLEKNQLFSGSITPGMVDALLEASRRSSWKVVLGLNLRDDRPRDAVALTHYAVAHDPTHQLLAVEIGNEPTAYLGADGDRFIARVNSYVEALKADPVTRDVLITGPSLANETDLTFLTRMRQSFGSRLPFLTWHHYANRPTLADLLSEPVSREWTDRLAAVHAAADGFPTRMDEGNSVGRGGLDRVSNVMGSTAWMTDAMLTGAAAGLAGYNAHGWDGYYYPSAKRTSYYTPFVVRGGLVFARPEFYALALLKDIAGKRFCRGTTAAVPDKAVKAWSLRDPSTGHLLVYVVDKGAAGTAAPVVVTAPLGYAGGAVVSRISDPGGCAGRDTDIDGRTLSTRGSFTWMPTSVPAAPGISSYALPLGACQTALLDVSPG